MSHLRETHSYIVQSSLQSLFIVSPNSDAIYQSRVIFIIVNVAQCYRLNIWVLPKFMCCNPHRHPPHPPTGDGDFGWRLGYKGRALMRGISVLIKAGRESALAPSPT